MNVHKKKMIAPILITAIFVLYYVGFAAACIFIPGIPLLVKLVLGVPPLILAGVMICLLRKRMKEIRSGEEDDLSQY